MFLFDINNGAERHSNGDNDNHFDNHNNLVITATIRPPPKTSVSTRSFPMTDTNMNASLC